MALRRLHKQLNSNNSSSSSRSGGRYNNDNNASGDYLRDNVDVDAVGEDDFKFGDDYYYGPDGDCVQLNAVPNYFDGREMGRRGYEEMDDRRRQRSDPRDVSRKHDRHARRSSDRPILDCRRSSAQCVQVVILVLLHYIYKMAKSVFVCLFDINLYTHNFGRMEKANIICTLLDKCR